MVTPRRDSEPVTAFEEPPPKAAHLAVDLVMDFDNNSLSGTVGWRDRPPVAFSGWIGLMAAIDTLRHERARS